MMSQERKARIIICGNADTEGRIQEMLAMYKNAVILVDSEALRGDILLCQPDRDVRVVQMIDDQSLDAIIVDDATDINYESPIVKGAVLAESVQRINKAFSRSVKSSSLLASAIEELKVKASEADNRDNAEVRYQRNQNRLRAKFHRR